MHFFRHATVSMGWLSSDASSSSLQILMVLSASHVMSLVPVRSNSAAKIPFSASRLPGWAMVSVRWKQWPVP